MLNREQQRFREDILSPLKQKLYFLRSLPMGLISGVRLVKLDEEASVAEVPFFWVNKNPFKSMYFAVQSMAAELSTAAPVIMALKAIDADVAFIIVEVKAEFVKKAQSKVRFTCQDHATIFEAISSLKQPGDTIKVTARAVGRDMEKDEVATFYFTWSLRLRS